VVRHHLRNHEHLLNKKVGELTGQELEDWRNALLMTNKAATVLRVLKSAKACLNRAAKLDHRISNRNAWRDGLSGVKVEDEPENRVLSDAQVITLVEAAYALRPDFGLFIDVLATTGTRTSQASRLTVSNLVLGDNGTPKLMMPPSRKGKRRTPSYQSVPITKTLAAKLSDASRGRPGYEPLLRRADGSAWDPENAELWTLFREIATSTGIDCTAYALRHSSIRQKPLERRSDPYRGRHA
jgi:integrase